MPGLSIARPGSVATALLLAATAAFAQPDAARDDARAITDPPFPSADAMRAVAARINGEPIRLRAILDEAALLYAVPATDMLVQEAILRAEARRRGVTPSDAAVDDEIARFVATRNETRPLADVLRQRRMSWSRFHTRMRHNAIRSALLAKDRVDARDETAASAWQRRLTSLYDVTTDPLALPEGTFAIVRDTKGAEVAQITTDDLLAERLPTLTLRHLDRALAERARIVAIDATLRARGIAPSASRVAARVGAFREQHTDAFPWEQALRAIGRNAHLEIRRFRHDDAIDQVIGTDADDATLRAYYTARPDHFGRATVTASHILIRNADPVTGRIDYEAARRRIVAVARELAGGASFESLARRYSEDAASRERGGDIGMFTLVSAYDRDFCRLAFTLREGEVSPPVKTRQGWHLIKCRQRTEPRLDDYPFERVRDIVRDDRQDELRRRWIERNVEVDVSDVLDRVALRYVRPVRVQPR